MHDRSDRNPRDWIIAILSVVCVSWAVPGVRAEILVSDLPECTLASPTSFPCFRRYDAPSASPVFEAQAGGGDVHDVLFHPIGMMFSSSFYFLRWEVPTPATAVPPPTDPGDPSPPSSGSPPVWSMPPAPQPPTSRTSTPITSTTGGKTPPPVANTPEPATFVSGVLGAGLVGWVNWRRRRKV